MCHSHRSGKTLVAEVEAIVTDFRNADGQAIQNAAQPLLACAKGLLHLLAFGDVENDRDALHRASLAVRYRSRGEIHPDRLAVLAQVALFETNRRQIALDHLPHLRHLAAGKVGGMREILEALALDLFDGVTEHLGKGLVCALNLSCRTLHLNDADCRLAEQRAKALLAREQRGIDIAGHG